MARNIVIANLRTTNVVASNSAWTEVAVESYADFIPKDEGILISVGYEAGSETDANAVAVPVGASYIFDKVIPSGRVAIKSSGAGSANVCVVSA